jgi:hypothetical protein
MANSPFSTQRLSDAANNAKLVVNGSDPPNRIAPPPGEAGFSGLYFYSEPLQDAKTAILLPLTLSPVVFVAPQLEILAFAITDKRSWCEADRDYSPLMSYHAYDANHYTMLQNLKHFEVVCSAADDIEIFMQWLGDMPRLRSLPVTASIKITSRR